MSRLLIDSFVCWLGTGVPVMSELNLELNYRLTVIQDEQVPLAHDLLDRNSFFPMMVAIMVAVFIGTLVSIYYVRCRACQKRILELGGNGSDIHSGWNLKRMRDTINEMEWNLVADNEAYSS